jgi:hypothetical protein
VHVAPPQGIVADTFNPAAFRVIMVEMDGQNQDKDTHVDQLFRAAGMKHLPGLRVGLNEIYVRSDVEAAFRAAME